MPKPWPKEAVLELRHCPSGASITVPRQCLAVGSISFFPGAIIGNHGTCASTVCFVLPPRCPNEALAMRALTRTIPGQLRRTPAALAGFLVFVIVAAYVVSDFILSGQTTNFIYGALAFGGVAITVAMLHDWRRGIYFFIGWLLLEDLARKYLGNNMAIYFGKDILVLVAYLSVYSSCRRKDAKSFRPPFAVPLLLLIWFGVLQIFNPGSNSVFLGILGMKLYFLYVPLMFVGYALVDSEEELSRLLSFNALFAVIIGGLAIAQAVLGHTFLNPARPADDIRELSQLYRASPITGQLAYRPTSVFVSTGRLVDYMLVSWFLTLGFCGYLLLRSRKRRIIAYLALGTIATAIVLSASRGVFLWAVSGAIVGAGAFLWGAPWRQGEARRVLRAIQRAILFVGMGLTLTLMVFPETLGSRLAIYDETLNPSSPASELVFRTRDYPLKNFLQAFESDRWPYGYGIGTASLGVQYVSRILHVPPMKIGVENGYGILVVELGIVGLLLFIVLSIAIALSAWRVVRGLKASPWFPVGFMIFWYAFMLLVPITYVGFQAYQDFVLNAYLWLFLGVLFRLPAIALSAQATAATAGARQHRRWIA